MASLERRVGGYRVRWRDPQGHARSRQCPTLDAAQHLRDEVEALSARSLSWSGGREIVPDRLKSISPILHRVPISTLYGVYFLICSDEVVYVGQSVCVHARVAQHFSERDKVFDRAMAIPVPRDQLTAAEYAFIDALAPRFNRSRPKRSPEEVAESLSLFGFKVEP